MKKILVAVILAGGITAAAFASLNGVNKKERATEKKEKKAEKKEKKRECRKTCVFS